MGPRRVVMRAMDRKLDTGFVGFGKIMRDAVGLETVDGCRTANVGEGRETNERERWGRVGGG